MNTSDLKANEYHSFYQPYIAALGEVELMDMLRRQRKNFPRFIESIPQDKLQHTYAEGKWTIGEVLVHIIDAERVFQYRALRFARNDDTPLAGFDQDAYVPHSMAKKRTIGDIIKEYKTVRKSTIMLYSSFDKDTLGRMGTASNVDMSVAALGFISCGHQKHHRNILRERYL